MMVFLKSFGVWALFTCAPVFVLVFQAGRINGGQMLVVFLVLMVPLAGTILLTWLIGERRNVKRSALYGLTLGFAIPTVGGYLLMKIVGGFESPAIFVGAATLSIPSSIGGVLAGWIQGRSMSLNKTSGNAHG
jgi:hypothetical protein